MISLIRYEIKEIKALVGYPPSPFPAPPKFNYRIIRKGNKKM